MRERLLVTGLVALVAAAVLLERQGTPSWVLVAGDSMLPTLQGGDLVVISRKEAYAAGDVVAYRVPEGEPGAGVVVIHRIVGGSAAEGYVVRGDNKDSVDPWQPRPEDVVGAQVLRVPRIGLAFGFLRTSMGLAALAALVTFALIASGDRRARIPETT